MLPASRFAPLPAFVHEVDDGVAYPRGFLAAGVASGVKKRGKLDLGILASAVASVSAATFTGTGGRRRWTRSSRAGSSTSCTSPRST